MNTASTISQRDAYKLMLKDYPDVMSIEQMCEILSISTKTGYRILRGRQNLLSQSRQSLSYSEGSSFHISLHRMRRSSHGVMLGLNLFTKNVRQRSSNSNPVLV